MPSVQEMGVNLIEFLRECWGGALLGAGVNGQDRCHGEDGTGVQNTWGW